jgi:hypothetical protein
MRRTSMLPRESQSLAVALPTFVVRGNRRRPGGVCIEQDKPAILNYWIFDASNLGFSSLNQRSSEN